MSVATARRLIVNADDLGMHPEIDAGIIEAHRRGIVTSASLMVRGASASGAAARASKTPSLSLGLHLDLSEWEYGDGSWTARYERADPLDPPAVEQELRAQLERFWELTDQDPTHLDSHQHVHEEEPVLTIAMVLAQELGVPLRNRTAGIAYCGEFYGQSGKGEPYPFGVTTDNLLAVLGELEPGVTELGCHPGRAVDSSVSSYARERALEVETLCDPTVRGAIETAGIELISFADVPPVSSPPDQRG